MLSPFMIGRAGWDPFAEMRRLQSDMNSLFDTTGPLVAGRPYPPVNVWLGENSVAVTAELPGVAPDDLDIEVQEDTLTLKGEHKDATDGDTGSWVRRERPTGRFSRTIGLPFRVDVGQVEARFQNGVLEIEMRRPEADRPRKIAIQAG